MCPATILITIPKPTTADSFLNLSCKAKASHSGNHWSEYDVGDLRQFVTWSDEGDLEINN